MIMITTVVQFAPTAHWTSLGGVLMARRAPKTSLQDRLAIQARTAAGESAPQIAQALGWSVATVRKWRRIARRGGSLSPRIGRAPTGPLSTYPPALVAMLRQLRQDHPGWGPATLLLELRRDAYWQTQPLPSRSQIAAWLKAAGLTRRYQNQRPLPQPPTDAPTRPHEAWQLDAQGAVTVGGVGTVSVIHIVDVVSRLKVESTPDVGHTQPATEMYQAALRRAFTTTGLPEQLTLDHGSAFVDNTTPSPFPTLLHVWLIALGILVRFTRKRRPTDHAIVERTHQTITRQALEGQTYRDADHLTAGLDARRAVLNQELPMQVLGGRAPLQAYPHAAHSGRAYRPEWEAALLDVERVVRYLGQGQWFRQANCHGEVFLGQQRYNVGKRWAKHEIAIRFDGSTREFVMEPAGSSEVLRRPIKGLTVEALMGTPAQPTLPAAQLVLPFQPEEWGVQLAA
jgi:transposase InsO family protein